MNDQRDADAAQKFRSLAPHAGGNLPIAIGTRTVGAFLLRRYAGFLSLMEGYALRLIVGGNLTHAM